MFSVSFMGGVSNFSALKQLGNFRTAFSNLFLCLFLLFLFLKIFIFAIFTFLLHGQTCHKETFPQHNTYSIYAS